MPDLLPEHVQDISGFEDLLSVLDRRLRWPLEEAHLDEVTFEEDLAEIGIEPGSARLQSVHQLRPLITGQPWGILLLRFDRRKLPVTALRRILRFFARKQIARSQAATRATWPINHILFVIDHGDDETRQFSFAHFDGTHAHNAKLSVFGWEPGEPCRTLCEYNLPALEWPDDPNDADAWIARWTTAFDVEKVTDRFFADFKRLFEHTREQIRPAFGGDDDACHDFTQRLFNRLLFLTFVQKKRWLDNDPRYLFNRFDQVKAADLNYYDDFLHHLFFWALCVEPSERNRKDVGAWMRQHLGKVPFLNGGLFEEMDRWDYRGKVPIANEVFEAIFSGLLDRYNFTVTESTPLDIEVAIDPEMLGKVFEELVTGRHESGSFYTPKPVVAFMCREALKGYLAGAAPGETPEAVAALVEQHDPQGLRDPEGVLDALRRVRVGDPACGSGAYLLGMMQELVALRACLFTAHNLDPQDAHQRKLEIIQRNLYGVDLDPFAVNIARLRLWLSLAVDYEGQDPPPLPNLDMKIEVGDTLTAPAPDFARNIFRDRIEREADALATLKADYLMSHGDRKRDLKQQIDAAQEELREAFADQPAPEEALDWRTAFPEVFKEGGFDIVLANPPYVRQELIGPTKQTLRELYPDATTGKSDLYCYFYARALQLLRPGGQHVFICSNSWLDVGYGGKLQEYLLDRAHVRAIYDSAVERQFATADINTIISHLEKAGRREQLLTADPLTRFVYLKAPFEQALAHPELRRELLRSRSELWQAGLGEPDRRNLRPYQGDKWGGKYLRAPDIYWRILEKAGDRLVRLGDIADVRRGFTTGANDFFFVKVIGRQDGETVTIEAGDGSAHPIEADFVTWPVLTKAGELVRPAIRGEDLRHRLLTITRPVDESCPLARDYVRWGEATPRKFHLRPTCRQRGRGSEWYMLPPRPAPHAAVPIGHKRRPVAALLSDTMVGDNLVEVMLHNAAHAELVATSVFSAFSMLQYELLGRANFGQGLLKTQTYELHELLVVRPAALPADAAAALEHAFRLLAARKPLMVYDEVKQPDRDAFEGALLSALGFDDAEERQEVLEELTHTVCRVIWDRLAKSDNSREMHQSYDEWLASGEPFGLDLREEDEDAEDDEQ